MPGCRYSMRDASLRPRKHRPVRHLSAAATGPPQLPPSQPTIPNLRQKPLVTTLDLPGANPDQEACSRCSNRRSGRSRVAGSRIAAEADVPAAGEMEGNSESHAQGDVATVGWRGSWGSAEPPSRNTRMPTVLRGGVPGLFSLRQHPIQWRHNKVTFMLNT